MKIFFKFLLCGCAIFSICAVLFRLGVIPPLFGNSDNAQNVNEVIVNLSYSYLAGLIFYFLNEYIPSWNSRKKAEDLISPKMLSLYSKMDYLLAITKLEADLKKENEDISLKDCEFANTVSLEEGKVAVRVYVRINSNLWRTDPTSEWYEKIYTQSKEVESIKKIITEIETSTLVMHLDSALLNLLFEIKHSGFFLDIRTRKEMKKETNANSTAVHNGQQKLYEYIQLLLRLKSYKFDKHEHKIEKMSPEEEASYKQFLNEMSPYIETMIKQNGKFRIFKGTQQIK